jgi:hypothetical protein
VGDDLRPASLGFLQGVAVCRVESRERGCSVVLMEMEEDQGPSGKASIWQPFFVARSLVAQDPTHLGEAWQRETN